MKAQLFKVLSLVTLILAASGCVPEHLAKLDGESAVASFEPVGSSTVILKDDENREFEITSPHVSVSFEINRVMKSKLYVKDNGHQATFVLPKSVLNSDGSVINVSSAVSKQPVDLVAQETVKVLKEWDQYRHESTPIYMTTCSSDSNGNTTCSQTLIGFSDDYYRDRMGTVERGLVAQVYSPGSTRKLADINMIVVTRTERLTSTNVSHSEYSAHAESY